MHFLNVMYINTLGFPNRRDGKNPRLCGFLFVFPRIGEFVMTCGCVLSGRRGNDKCDNCHMHITKRCVTFLNI
jgi:hypothetical protein